MMNEVELENGVNLIVHKGDKDSVLHNITAQKTGKHGYKALWIDTENHGSSYQLAAAGNQEVLDKVEIARAFTTYQHYTLVQRIDEYIKPDTELILLPSIDGLYETGQLNEDESRELLKQSLNHLNNLAENKNLEIAATLSKKGKGEYHGLVETKSVKKVEADSQMLGKDLVEESGYGYRVLQTRIPDWIENREELKEVVYNR